MRVTQSVIPAKAGNSQFESVRVRHETPAIGHPSKYYFDGTLAGVTRSC